LNEQAANCTMIPGSETKKQATRTTRRAGGILHFCKYWQGWIAGVYLMTWLGWAGQGRGGRRVLYTSFLMSFTSKYGCLNGYVGIILRSLIAESRDGMALPVWLDPEMQEEDGRMARCGWEGGMGMGHICLRCMNMISVGAISKTRGI